MADDVTATLVKIPARTTTIFGGGRDAAGKTGTWELKEKSSDNAHAWMVGYTPQVATAVWVGNVGKVGAIRSKGGRQDRRVQSARATSGSAFMDEEHDGPGGQGVPRGVQHRRRRSGQRQAPSPEQPTQAPCLIPAAVPHVPGRRQQRRWSATATVVAAMTAAAMTVVAATIAAAAAVVAVASVAAMTGPTTCRH